MRDELNEPLGLASGVATVSPAGGWRAGGGALLAAVALAASVGLVTLARRDSPLGGEPFAVAKIEVAPAPSAPAAANVAARARDAEAPPIASAGQLEAVSRVKVTRAGGGSPPNARIIDVERALAVRLDPAPDPRLIVTSRTRSVASRRRRRRAAVRGLRQTRGARSEIEIRRVADRPDGRGPRPQCRGNRSCDRQAAWSGDPWVCALWQGIEERATEAREAGHETALQAPMEDFSDLTGDPGPHTLKASASDGDNLDSLRWLMSRFTGYIAVVNHLGGKFTADSKEVSLVLTEIAARGLGYLDDWASPRSVAPDVAAALAMTSARADLVIDAEPTPEAIETALARLLDRAHERGSAIGVERLAAWANGLESKGVALVPLSALMSAAPGRSAQSKP